MGRRFVAALAGAVVVGALAAPVAAQARDTTSGPSSLRVAVPGTRAPAGHATTHTYLPIHPRAYHKAKAAANLRASERAHRHAAPTSAVHGGPTRAGWDGQNENDLTPPDPTGAIGPTRYIELINLRFGIYNRSGALISAGPLSDLTNVTDNMSDPQILWDPATRHFYYLVLDFTTNEFAIGWSKDDSPSGPADFCKYVASYGYGGFFIPDYPKLGTSGDFLLIGANVFLTIFESYQGSDVDWITKPAAGPLATCPDPSGFKLGSFVAVKNANGSDATTPVPAVQTDTDGSGWVVALPDPTETPNANYLTVFQVTGTRATGASISGPGTVPVAAYNVPASAMQPGGPTIDTLDGRLERAVSGVDPVRGNTMAVWTAHAVFGGAGSEERWYEIDPANRTVLQSGKATSPSLYVWNGAVSPDRAVNGGSAAYGGNMVMGFNTSSSSQFSAIQMVTKAGTDPQSGFVMVKQSPGANDDYSCNFPYGPPCRWGDYSGASADPTPDLSCSRGSVWLSGEWNATSTDSTGVDWRTWNWQASPAACTPPPPPPGTAGSPSLTSAIAGDGFVDLAWTAPAVDGGSAITGYDVYRGTTSGGEALLATGVSGTAYHDAATTNGVTYFYEVAAVNAGGEGARSNELSATPTGPVVPGAPSLSATALRGRVHLTWTVPSNGGTPITGYRIFRGRSSGAETLLATVGAVTAYNDSSAVRNVVYWYFVRAVNAKGAGPRSNEVRIRAK